MYYIRTSVHIKAVYITYVLTVKEDSYVPVWHNMVHVVFPMAHVWDGSCDCAACISLLIIGQLPSCVGMQGLSLLLAVYSVHARIKSHVRSWQQLIGMFCQVSVCIV
jgi:hypothetical protein